MGMHGVLCGLALRKEIVTVESRQALKRMGQAKQFEGRQTVELKTDEGQILEVPNGQLVEIIGENGSDFSVQWKTFTGVCQKANIHESVHAEQSAVPWPDNHTTYRGTSMPPDAIEFFVEGLNYRVP